MKKIFCIILSLLVLNITGCTNSATVKPSTDPIEYTIYLGGADLSGLMEDETKEDFSNSNQSMLVTRAALPEDCIFDFSLSDTIDAVYTVNKTAFLINGKNYSLENLRLRTNSLADSKIEALRQYGTVAECINSDYAIEFLPESGELRFYNDSDIDRMAEGDFKEEDVISASKKVLTEYYGAACLQYYDMEPTVSPVITDYYDYWVVTYTKYIEGYRTGDLIQLRYNKQGELICINAKQYGLMKSMVDRFSKKQLQTAEEFLSDYLDSISCQYDKKFLTLLTNSNGECYFKLTANYKIGEESRMRTFYVNVD